MGYEGRLAQSAADARFEDALERLAFVLRDLDPGLADLALDVAANGIGEVIAIVRAVPRPEAEDIVGMRYLPPGLEDPRRPGCLEPDELRRRRRAWAKSGERARLYAEYRTSGAPCALCSAEFRWDGEPPYLVVDHIVPLLKGGTNARANFQPLCERCNLRKGARF